MKLNNSFHSYRIYERITQIIGMLFPLLFRKVSVLWNSLSTTSVTTMKPSIKPSYFRPPGAIDEQDFVKVCIRCRRCADVCSSNSIRPLSLLRGLSVAWTPVITVDSEGYCIRCLKCTRICPSGALAHISRNEIKIGTAVIDETKCYDWTIGESNCQKCILTCPLINEGKIAIKLINGKPVVQKDKCIGCAICAIRCPANAITISHGDEIEENTVMGGSATVA